MTTSTLLTVREAQIELQPGERYAGLALDAEGHASHHLVLLPGEAENVSWQAAKDWAATAGGDLPTRQEQSLLFANLKSEFKPRWYWSGQEYDDDSSYAWSQSFDGGDQRNSWEERRAGGEGVRRSG